MVTQKATHTNRYVKFYSNHNRRIEKSVIKFLYDRDIPMSSSNTITNNKDNYIKEGLSRNQYPHLSLKKQYQL